MKRILIIGGVAAGATAAARARRMDGQAEITILEAGADVSFANCGLPYYLGGQIEHRSSLILASPETFHDQYRIKVHTNTEAVAIDRQKKTVRALNNKTKEEKDFSYDSLILAQGGKPIVLPLPGVDMDHVFQLWTLDDMDAIDHYLHANPVRTAAVIGGGFIGLEMVEALVDRGLQVSLIEATDQIMPALEPEIAGLLTQELAEHDVQLYTGTAMTAIEKGAVKTGDGRSVPADLVLMSVGVKPTLALAEQAGLQIGSRGGLQVNEYLQTNDPDIFAAGDMLEIPLRRPGAGELDGQLARVPLAGPANRQGRIVAENALGGRRAYKGAYGTSIVKLFSVAAGSTGLSIRNAREASLDVDAVVVHKVSHTAYYPGAEKVSLMLIYDRQNGRVLGAQAAGKVGIDKRLDVIAVAIAGGLSIEDLAELDLAYAPPFNGPNGPVNMAAFTAINKQTGFSPAVLACDADAFVAERQPMIVDLRDPISYMRQHIAGSVNMSQNQLREGISGLPGGKAILLISDDGQKGHVALRMLAGQGVKDVFNLSGGIISLVRHATVVALQAITLEGEAPQSGAQDDSQALAQALAGDQPLIVDVRTNDEFLAGAYPGAIHIPLDEISERTDELGDRDREIILYCASGARSAYAVRVLERVGFTRVENGGGLHDMMNRR